MARVIPPTSDQMRELLQLTTRVMAVNIAQRLYADYPSWLGPQAPQKPQKPVPARERMIRAAKNRFADRLIEMASALKGYDVTGDY